MYIDLIISLYLFKYNFNLFKYNNILFDIFMNNELWCDKYKPKTLDDIIISKDIKTILKKWISEFSNKNKNKKTFKNCLFLYGPPGVGKTTIAHLILKEFNYDIIEFNSSNFRTQKLIREKINDILGKRNILNLLNNNKKEIAIIMDEIDGLTLGEKSGLSELMKIMFPKKTQKNINYIYINPFICISNSLDKKLSDLKKKTLFINVNKPIKMFLLNFSKSVLKKENIEINEEVLNYIISKSQSDYRRLLILLEYVYKDKEYVNDLEKVESLLENYMNKDIDYTYYQSTEKMFLKYNTVNVTNSLYNINKGLIPMIFYENFIEYIIQNKKDSDKNKLNAITSIYKNYSISDKFDYNITINQQWQLYNYNCIYKCTEPSYLMNKLKKKSFNKYNTYNFSSLLNKTSQEYLNIKFNINLKYIIFKFSNTNLTYHFTDFLFSYIESKQYNIPISIINYYNLQKEDIDKLIKYLSEEKQKIYTVKSKNELKKILFNTY